MDKWFSYSLKSELLISSRGKEWQRYGTEQDRKRKYKTFVLSEVLVLHHFLSAWIEKGWLMNSTIREPIPIANKFINVVDLLFLEQ